MRTRDLFTSARAQDLRARSTDAERLLWGLLRARRLCGLKFVRQFPIAGYFADFACRERMLIVELDGDQHAESAYDDVRDARLVAEGYRVLRLPNAEIMRRLDDACQTILAAAQGELEPFDGYRIPAAHVNPSPRSRGEGGA